MATPAIAIDPNTGERIPTGGAIQIDPATGERVSAAAPPDDRNRLQKVLDASVQPDQPLDKGVLGQLESAYYGVPQGLERVVAHPVQTLEGIGQSIAHPIDTAVQTARNFAANPTLAVGQMLGATAAFAPAGELAGAAGRTAVGTVGRIAARAGIPDSLYESALKPPLTLSQSEREGLVQTGLQNELPVSKQGFKDISTAIDNLNQAVKDTIAADPNRPISTVPAIRNLASLRSRFANQVTPQPDMADINQVQANFLKNPQIQAPGGVGPTPGSLSAADAQAMKQGTYQALGSKAYGEVKGASIEAQKALARGLKEEIANQFPELQNLNAQESRLLDLQPVIERAIGRTGNHQLIGIGTPSVAGAGGAITGSAEAGGVIGAIKMVVDNPMVKSRIAIALSKAARIPLAQASARVQAYSSTLGSYAGATRVASGDQTASQ